MIRFIGQVLHALDIGCWIARRTFRLEVRRSSSPHPAIRGYSRLFAAIRAKFLFLCAAGAFLWPVLSSAAEPPTIPIGLDAYRQWQHWPLQRIGVRAYMRSTYDRSGGNEGADASHFLYQLDDNQNVTLDVAGSGILYFARYNHWHGSPWHYTVDGTDHIVQETSTADPTKPKENSMFIPESAFPNPLAWTWSDTRGADLSWVPISFKKSFRMAYSRTHYGTGYYIYHQFVPGVKLSQPIKSWTESAPDADVVELLNPRSSRYRAIDAIEGTTHYTNAFTTPLRIETKDPAAINTIEFAVPLKDAIEFGRSTLRITWDDAQKPSAEAPIALFFGAGTLYNRDNRQYLVNAFPVCIHQDRTEMFLSCLFPMPFFKSAQIEIINHGSNKITPAIWVHTVPLTDPKEFLTYFHATYHDHGTPEPGKDLVLLDTKQTEGGGDWSGHFIGTSFIFSDRAVLGTLEGDPRFFFDDSQTPQAQGTGTEEWGGGGDYWGGQNMTLPFAGHPTGAKSDKDAKCDEDKIESAYRFLLADLMPFGKNARIQLEHGGENQSTEHYQTVTYWYGVNHPTLLKTDTLKIGDSESEKSHNYNSPDASAPYQISSRYELGVDHLKDRTEIYPATTDTGRTTKTSSEFTLKLDPKNVGVMLRRKLDYSYPNQRAEVFIDDASSPSPPREERAGERRQNNWQPAGIWYTAGGNICVYSNPKGELGVTQHKLETSNRQFRDDEFLLPLALTKGRSEIRVRIKFTPVEIPFYPGGPIHDLMWSELRYDAYCWLTP
ncbi:MAG: DUF2961 domain-containing protein [Limisphaerales bacterium]